MATVVASTSYAKVVKANGLENNLEPVVSTENLMQNNAEEKVLPASPVTKPGISTF